MKQSLFEGDYEGFGVEADQEVIFGAGAREGVEWKGSGSRV